jgi:hypothetical protein
VTITVTQEHIDAGMRGVCTKCPIALAMIAAGISDPYVDEVAVCFNTTLGRPTVDLPAEAINFISKYDDGLDGRPFSFELEIPQ